jgi:hypothetical protein
MGASETPPLLPQTAIDRLDERLRSLRSGLELYFIVCVAMILVLFAAQIAVILVYISRPAVVQGALAAFGITASGLIYLMSRLWRDRDRTATLLVISSALGRESLGQVLEVLTVAYFPKPRPSAWQAAADLLLNLRRLWPYNADHAEDSISLDRSRKPGAAGQRAGSGCDPH